MQRRRRWGINNTCPGLQSIIRLRLLWLHAARFPGIVSDLHQHCADLIQPPRVVKDDDQQ